MNKVFRVLVTEYKEHEFVLEAIDEDDAREVAEDLFLRDKEPEGEWGVSEVQEWGD